MYYDFSGRIGRWEFEEYRRRMWALSRSQTAASGDLNLLIEWMDRRLAAIEAQLGIAAPPMSGRRAPATEADMVAALEQAAAPPAEDETAEEGKNDLYGLTGGG